MEIALYRCFGALIFTFSLLPFNSELFCSANLDENAKTRQPTKDQGLSTSSCNDVIGNYNSCTKLRYWELQFVHNKTIENNEKSKSYLENVYCGNSSGCLDITINFYQRRCSSIDQQGPNIRKKIAILQHLCSKTTTPLETCIGVIATAYAGINISASEQRNNTELIRRVNSTVAKCCLTELIRIHNTSVITKILPLSWQQSGIPLSKKCSSLLQPIASPTNMPVKISSTKTIVTSTLKSSITTKAHIQMKVSKPQKSRLIAGLVIASIIFIILAIVVGRFFYHRYKNHKRIKYEDYGYSQLKVILEDDLYDQDEDEQMLPL